MAIEETTVDHWNEHRRSTRSRITDFIRLRTPVRLVLVPVKMRLALWCLTFQSHCHHTVTPPNSQPFIKCGNKIDVCYHRVPLDADLGHSFALAAIAFGTLS